MGTYIEIESKLLRFIRKYNTNLLIKGILLFIALGLFYFLLTILLEYFLWLPPLGRKVLFISFIIIELLLFLFYIIQPAFQLIGLKRSLTKRQAAKYIGSYFPEVKDKLSNLIDLNDSTQSNELLLASIQQKSNDLEPISFHKAISFKTNKRYLFVSIIPVILFFLFYNFSDKDSISSSINRVVQYEKEFTPPSPFDFQLLTSNLSVIEGNSLPVSLHLEGSNLPENVTIHYKSLSYSMKNSDFQNFNYTFDNVQDNFSFYFTATNFSSKTYYVSAIKAPSIVNISSTLIYPKYTNKTSESFNNQTNYIIPEGTKITNQLTTSNTNILHTTVNLDTTTITVKDNVSSFSKHFYSNATIHFNVSNDDLPFYENIIHNIKVIKDQFPKINITTNIDSISTGDAQFAGKLLDDYGIHSLQLCYFPKSNPSLLQYYSIPVGSSSYEEFYYIFPSQLSLTEGTDYQFYFILKDNDALNKFKSVQSKTFEYYKPTTDEDLAKNLSNEKDQIDKLNNSLSKSQENKKDLNNLQKDIQNRNNLQWNDRQNLNDILQKNSQTKSNIKKQSQQIQNHLNELPTPTDPLLKQKQEAISERLQELQDMKENEDILKELERISDKIDREDLLKKLNKLASQSKQEERSLEKVLEMTKRYYVEQKAAQIKEQLAKLAAKQKELSKDPNSSSKDQESINKSFSEIQNSLKELSKENKSLKEPMDLPNTNSNEKEINDQLQKASDALNKKENSPSESEKNQKSKQAQKEQKGASDKMEQMMQQMASSMQMMQEESMEENIDDLRKIVENMVEFSFQQEALLNRFNTITDAHPDFSKNLKKQHLLKEYFEHIDDSLYVLSMRVPQLTTKIQKDLTNAHYNMDQSLFNLTEDKYNQAIQNQTYVMTAANNLANLLSSSLDQMQQMMQMPGSGKKGKQPDFSLPDIIKKQQENISQCENGKKPGKGKNAKPGDKGQKPGDSKGDKPGDKNKGESGKKGKDGKPLNGKDGTPSEAESQEIYQIYKQQNALRNQLNDMIDGHTGDVTQAKKVVKSMEDLERKLLNEGITDRVVEQMTQINYELLKLKNAAFEQGMEEKRTATTNTKTFKAKQIEDIRTLKKYKNQDEILNRQSLPLRTIYKKKVQDYFIAE